MRIFNQNQYNQSVSKYKLLSSNAGVGSIISTKLGTYILVQDLNKWPFIEIAQKKIQVIKQLEAREAEIYKKAKIELEQVGISIVQDDRFVNFIKTEQNLENLVCLIGIPDMTLNENFNTPNWKNHPIRKKVQESGEDYRDSHFMIPALHFPKWFKDSGNNLKRIGEWESIWLKECRKFPNEVKKRQFAPPRDTKRFLGKRKAKNEDGADVYYREYLPLQQSNMILICPNGHLTDVPWSKFLRWKTEKQKRDRPDSDVGQNLFNHNDCQPCCSRPQLKWTENTTKSEGYGSIYIECSSCQMGSGTDSNRPKINLEGINNLEPHCNGHKPWERDINDGESVREDCWIRGNRNNGPESMKLSLVTSNDTYYANIFSSLFIPIDVVQGISQEMVTVLDLLRRKYERFSERYSLRDYWNRKYDDIQDFEELLAENQIIVPDVNKFKDQVQNAFNNPRESEDIEDSHEYYRWQEYKCFTENDELDRIQGAQQLSFNNVDIQNPLTKYFNKIQQVQELSITGIQLDFTRIKPKERIVLNGEVQISSTGQMTHSNESNQIFALPANDSKGEGVFFNFSKEAINSWLLRNEDVFAARYSKILSREPNENEQGYKSKMTLFKEGLPYLLIHTFSHLIMREFEFSCGYPTASLKERIFVSANESNPMQGVLIYTTEGSEGSMGGLVSQVEPNIVYSIIYKALKRGVNCSNDPLCWESEGQGLFELNFASCFSCSLTSETSCEAFNLGLDRRLLVDSNFGFFKDIVYKL